MDQKDIDEIQKVVNASILAALPTIKQACQPGSQQSTVPYPTMTGRTHAEIGSPEFAEDRTQINSLNNKFIVAQEFAHFNTDLIRSRDHHSDVAARGLQSLTEAVNLQTKINQEYLSGAQETRKNLAEVFAQRIKIADMWAYNQGYDIANPIAVGAGANLGAGSVPSNRAVDVAAAGQAVNAVAVGAAVANAVNALNPVLVAAVGDAVAAAFKANFPVSGGPQNTTTVPTPPATGTGA